MNKDNMLELFKKNRFKVEGETEVEAMMRKSLRDEALIMMTDDEFAEAMLDVFNVQAKIAYREIREGKKNDSD